MVFYVFFLSKTELKTQNKMCKCWMEYLKLLILCLFLYTFTYKSRSTQYFEIFVCFTQILVMRASEFTYIVQADLYDRNDWFLPELFWNAEFRYDVLDTNQSHFFPMLIFHFCDIKWHFCSSSSNFPWTVKLTFCISQSESYN